MAFIFVPNADGSFTEGDKQTNPDTGVEYIYSDGAWRALGAKIEDEFDTLDDRYIKKQGTQNINQDHWKIIQKNQDGNNRTFVDIYDGEMHLYNVADPNDGADGWAANKKYVKDVAADYLPLAGGNLTGDVESTGKFTLDHGTGGPKERKFLIKGETTDGVDGDLFYSYKNDDGSLDAVNYKGKITVDSNVVNKKYVDDKVASSGGGVPVGSIMIWMNSTVPDGWFKLQGGTFDVNTYPQLHAYLQSTSGYSSGRLPSWGGHYPGEYGDHLNQSLGSKQGARTAKPSGGSPKSTSNTIPTGATRTFTSTGNTNAYSAGQGFVEIGNGWDSTTRPKTVVVHYIIKHD